MAIFSLRHTWLGKSHQKYKPGFGAAHANYVTRQSSCTKLVGERAPVERHALKAWLEREEGGDRKNARIIDKVMVALPVELSPAQREALVRAYGQRVSQGRASWVAAIHDSGKDAHNPHAHFIFRDRDFETGRRVIMTTELGSTERLRRDWEEVTNRALQGAGLDLRIDRRSLAAQGIERKPGEHAGPKAPAKKPERTDQVQIAAGRAGRFDGDEKRRRRRSDRPHSQSPEWTGHGGMVAQQWSARHWLEANAGRKRKTKGEGKSTSDQFRVGLTDEQKAEVARTLSPGGRGGRGR
jgi:hypothetical protein